MYAPNGVPFDASALPSYLENELRSIAREINGYETKRYVPVWSSSGASQPVLGNGSLVGRYRFTNDFCELWVRFVAGSTTTFGDGGWWFSVPRNAKEFTQIGSAFMLDSGTSRFAGACEVQTTDNRLRVLAHGSLDAVRNTAPFTWANGDSLDIHARYLCQ